MHERLKQLRKTLDLTQRAFAERIGTKQNTVATYEMGRNNPSDPVIYSICREFNVNEDWLRYGTGSMFNENSTFSLDEYADANGLSDKEREIVRRFMELPKDVRSAIYHIFEPESGSGTIYDDVPDTADELEAQCPPVDGTDEDVG